ncbi:MAG: DNA polymerase III subunit delta' [Acidobacteriota bacterium]
MPYRDVVGHERVIELLARSIRRDALPPSLIFAGPAGVGKRLIAVATAQLVNCLTPPSQTGRFDACGTCAACTRIARGVHADVLMVQPGDNESIKLDQVREVIDRAGYRPFEGRRRVVIFDEADALIVQGQNALLKTLEEPPSTSMFILVTARPDSLLSTVRSRCPRLGFRALTPQEIAAVLMQRGRPESVARATAATADGSLGRALQMSGSDLVAARDVAQAALERAAAAPDPRRRIEGAKELLANAGSGGASDREKLASHLRAMASLVRDVELLSTSADVRALANADVQPVLERLIPAFGGERGARAFSAIDRALVALDRNAGVKIVADWLVLQL